MLTKNVDLNNKTILVTGAAGFIGANLVMELLRTAENVHIVGLDSVNDYYDVSIKHWRLAEIEKLAGEYPTSKWTFVKGNLADKALI
ncbi:MAG: GDP-mannose 4,6-dehydratase, partial [Oscillospiraceae bacterium]|nr:GDP-mannose 4,6-dehydratase [Oscillospiraceae bacterium]